MGLPPHPPFPPPAVKMKKYSFIFTVPPTSPESGRLSPLLSTQVLATFASLWINGTTLTAVPYSSLPSLRWSWGPCLLLDRAALPGQVAMASARQVGNTAATWGGVGHAGVAQPWCSGDLHSPHGPHSQRLEPQLPEPWRRALLLLGHWGLACKDLPRGPLPLTSLPLGGRMGQLLTAAQVLMRYGAFCPAPWGGAAA